MPVECPNGECSASELRVLVAELTVLLEQLDARLLIVQKDLAELTSQINRGRGAIWAFLLIGGVVAWVVNLIADKVTVSLK